MRTGGQLTLDFSQKVEKRSKDNLQEQVLSFHCVDSRIKLKSLSLHGKLLHLLNHPSGPKLVLLKVLFSWDWVEGLEDHWYTQGSSHKGLESIGHGALCYLGLRPAGILQCRLSPPLESRTLDSSPSHSRTLDSAALAESQGQFFEPLSETLGSSKAPQNTPYCENNNSYYFMHFTLFCGKGVCQAYVAQCLYGVSSLLPGGVPGFEFWLRFGGRRLYPLNLLGDLLTKPIF